MPTRLDEHNHPKSSCIFLTEEENLAVHKFSCENSNSHVNTVTKRSPCAQELSQALGYDFNPGCLSEFPGVTRPENAESLPMEAAIHGQRGDHLLARQALQGKPRRSYARVHSLRCF